MLLRATLSLVGLIVAFSLRDDLREQIQQRQDDLGRTSTVDVDGIFNTIFAVTIVLGIVFTVLYVALAFQVRAGRQWARVVTWVFAGLGVLGLLGTLNSQGLGVSRALSGVNGVIDIAIIVLLALRPTSEYVNRMRLRRR